MLLVIWRYFLKIRVDEVRGANENEWAPDLIKIICLINGLFTNWKAGWSVQRETLIEKRNVRTHHAFFREWPWWFLWGWILEGARDEEYLQVEVGKLDFFNGFRVSLEYNVWKTFIILLVLGACVNIGRTARQHRNFTKDLVACHWPHDRCRKLSIVSSPRGNTSRCGVKTLRSFSINVYINKYISNVIYKYIVVCIHIWYK